MHPHPSHSTYASESDYVTRSAVTHTKCNRQFLSQRTGGLSAESNPLDTSTCQQCKTVLQWAFRTLSDPGFKARLENDLDENICSHFPYLPRLECISVVSDSFDGLLRIFDQADLDAICATFRMCPNVSTTLPLVDSLRIPRDPEASLPGVCHLCELAINKLISLLIDKPTEEGIAAALDQVCNLLPSAYKTDCDYFVKNYGGKVVSAIIEGTAPKLICFSLGLCDSAYPVRLTNSGKSLDAQTSSANLGAHSRCNDNARFSWIKRPSSKGHPKWTSRNQLADAFVSLRDAPSCDQCVAVFQQASKTLNDPMVQDQLKILVDDRVCSRLPSFLHAACTTAINDHFDEIVQALQQVDPKEICSLTGMCPKSVTDLPPGTKRQTALSPGLPLPSTCVVCELVTYKIISTALTNASESSLTSALNQVCGYVPLTYNAMCYVLVDTYGPEIIKAIIQGTAPKAICHLLNLCGSDSNMFITMDHASTTQPATVLQSAPCEVCKFVIQAVKYQLQQNATEDRLDELVKRMCTELPQSYVNECMNLVDTYLSTVIRYIEESMTAEEVCQTLGLCPSINRTTDPAICLRGPSLWFSSVPYAILCNAMRFWRSFTHLKQRSTVELEGLCRSRNLDHICSSFEIEHMCNRTNECILHRANQYLQMVSQHMQHNDMSHLQARTPVVYNCTICELLVDRMRLHNRLFRRTIVSKSFCLEFEDTDDRKQCGAVMERKRELYDALRYGTDKQKLCKNMSLCKPKLNEADKDKVSAFALACASGPLFSCSSRRNAEMCGMTHLCNTLSWFSDEKWTGTSKRGDTVLDKFGQNVCTWGAVYWCQSPENARRCGPGAVKHCETRVWLKSIESMANKCSRGPSYYCQSPETARSCGPHAVNLCRQRLLLQPIS
ncbi:unnamed protein product [Dicrocoelium dendriticum]|nr:unnamed protein product [Dicrocoelium dendriticum]